MLFIKKNLYKLFLVLYTILLPVISFADQENSACNPADGKICNPLASKGINSIPDFIRVLLDGALRIGIPIIALAIIYCGFLFVEARGNSEKLTKAKDALLYTLIGAAVLLGSLAIAQLIADTVVSLK